MCWILYWDRCGSYFNDGKDSGIAFYWSEIQEEVAKMASRSVMLNHLGDKVSIICGDLKIQRLFLKRRF